jgi:hypothetical protein
MIEKLIKKNSKILEENEQLFQELYKIALIQLLELYDGEIYESYKELFN